jgi:small subunit ribosomal protein MRP21
MAYPPSPFDPSSSPFSLSQDVEREVRILKPLRVPIKLGPSTGRSVQIGAGIDVGRGFKLLEQSCARNGVKRDANNQRFHERPGLKRKRLRRERWRRKFLEGFKATVGRVKQLKNQGW